MIHLSLLVTIVVTALLWVNESGGRTLLGEDGSRWFWGGYGLWMNLMFCGVIGVGFIPYSVQEFGVVLGVHKQLFLEYYNVFLVGFASLPIVDSVLAVVTVLPSVRWV